MPGSRVLLLSYAVTDCDLAASSADLPSEGLRAATTQDQEATSLIVTFATGQLGPNGKELSRINANVHRSSVIPFCPTSPSPSNLPLKHKLREQTAFNRVGKSVGLLKRFRQSVGLVIRERWLDFIICKH